MSKCTNKGIGILLHGYEIGILSEQECEQFELHLLQCEHCHNLINGFEQQASLLMNSKRVKTVIDKTLSEETDSEPFVSRIWKRLWPSVPFVFKPAVAYLLILLLTIPAYYGLRKSGTLTISNFKQTIHLSPTRGVVKMLSKNTSDSGLLTFQFDGYRPGGIYKVLIESEDSVVIYRNDKYSSFDERNIGSLNLPIIEMKPGKYRLIISDPRTDSALVSEEYLFWVEE